jgi:mono/diheme cytochrome c family protein
MIKYISQRLWLFIFSVGLIIASMGCEQNHKNTSHFIGIPESPSLSAKQSMELMHIEKGFVVKLVAEEPLVSAPVAMNFDEHGRLWVVEMENYMPDTLGTGEDNPTGKIAILSDKNGDGLMDERKVFLDSLVLPRAICLIDNGILVAESPRLWFYEIKNDHPVKKILVDSAYAIGGNVEHQPNSLFRAMDNWIYSGESHKRYKKNGDHWLIEKTHMRGQWGMTQDDQGRLFYNNNSENLLGDYFSPGVGAYNLNQRHVSGFNEKIVPDTRVYPARPNTGVNRGYMDGILDDSMHLVNFTAACGPVIYSGNLFGPAYYGNAFIAEPAANLIKRDILSDEGFKVKGEVAYKNKEFLASEDERFRPVNLYNGPDGALYIVDMYRGIIQHKTYLTPYLKSEIKKRDLTTPLNCGRIYKVVPIVKKEETVSFTDPDKLVALLQNPSAWVRSKAQDLLVDKKNISVAPQLRKLLENKSQPFALIHSLWTLEGLGVLQVSDVLPLLQENNEAIKSQALSVLPSLLDKKNYRIFLPIFEEIVNSNDSINAPYVAFLAHFIKPFNSEKSRDLLISLIKKYPDNKYIVDAVISNLQDDETAWYKISTDLNPDTNLIINRRLKTVINDKTKALSKNNAKMLEKDFPKGAKLFQSVCQTCHGMDGGGIQSLAPPLNNSNWVNGEKNTLISIVLYGLNGPVPVAGKTYQAPEINGEMPGIGSNSDIKDDDVAQVLNYIRNSWSNHGSNITIDDVKTIRSKFKGRQKSFTIKELNGLKF